jgi:protoporphyrinogen oxidase
MDRRSFITGAATCGAAVLGGAALFRRWQEITPAIHAPGREEGHYLRDASALPPPSSEVTVDVVILGSGIAALTAAWKLGREGHKNVLMIEGPEHYGNAAGGSFGEFAYPTGAHYLPLPTMESTHVRELLSDLGMIQRDAFSEKPYYDEQFLLHGPEDRLLVNGVWQDGLAPSLDKEEHARFHAEVHRLRHLRGADGQRAFAFPVAASSPIAVELDQLSFKQWLVQNGYRSQSLHWYLDYACRDDYGARYDQVSAWAGLHYFASRTGQGANAAEDALLTWPGGLHPLAAAMEKKSGVQRRKGTAVRVRHEKGVEVLCFKLQDGKPSTYTVKARKVICAMPLYVAARVVEDIGKFGFDARRDLPQYAPWMVANFLMKGFPKERTGVPLAWDNVVYQGPGLGYVVSTHQDIRVTPPDRTVFTAYMAMDGKTPQDARKFMMAASREDLLGLASADLKAAYGDSFFPNVERCDITLRGHAMAIPGPGFRSNAGLKALRELEGPVLFAHADLTGFSVFEEASWWGYRAARLCRQ